MKMNELNLNNIQCEALDEKELQTIEGGGRKRSAAGTAAGAAVAALGSIALGGGAALAAAGLAVTFWGLAPRKVS